MKTYHHSVCQKVFYRTWLGLTQCHQRSLIFIFWSFFYHSQPLRQRDLWKMFATCSQSNVTCGSLDFIRLLYWFWTNNATKQQNHERQINIWLRFWISNRIISLHWSLAKNNNVHSSKRRKAKKQDHKSTPHLQLWTASHYCNFGQTTTPTDQKDADKKTNNTAHWSIHLLWNQHQRPRARSILLIWKIFLLSLLYFF